MVTNRQKLDRANFPSKMITRSASLHLFMLNKKPMIFGAVDLIIISLECYFWYRSHITDKIHFFMAKQKEPIFIILGSETHCPFANLHQFFVIKSMQKMLHSDISWYIRKAS